MRSYRLVVWPILLLSYGAIFAAAMYLARGLWPSAAVLGMLFVTVFGIPALVGYAAYLWRKQMLHGAAKVEAMLSLVLLVLYIVLVAKYHG